MINARSESDFRRLERIISREMNSEKEHAALIRTVRGTHNRRLPMEQIVADGSGGTQRGRITTDILQLFLNSLQSHFRRIVQAESRTCSLRVSQIQLECSRHPKYRWGYLETAGTINGPKKDEYLLIKNDDDARNLCHHFFLGFLILIHMQVR